MTRIKTKTTLIKWSAIALALSAIAACGGGGGSGGGTTTPPTTPVSFTNSVTKGPIFDARVTATGLACTNTNDAGVATCALATGAAAPFVITSTGGRFCVDERRVSSGCVTQNSGVLRTVALTATNVRTTPFTEAAVRAAGGNAAGFTQAYQNLATTLGIPLDPTFDPLANTNAAALLQAFTNALVNGVSFDDAVARVQAGRNPQTNQPVNNGGTVTPPPFDPNQSCPTGASGSGVSGSTGTFFDSAEGRTEGCVFRAEG